MPYGHRDTINKATARQSPAGSGINAKHIMTIGIGESAASGHAGESAQNAGKTMGARFMQPASGDPRPRAEAQKAGAFKTITLLLSVVLVRG